MSTELKLTERTYELSGVGISVCADQRPVLEELDLRLRGLTVPGGARAGVRFTFLTGARDDPRLAPPAGDGRPVYETPYGPLHYFPDADAIYGELAGVRLLCDAAAGTAVLSGATLAGLELYLAAHPLATIALMEMLERRGLFSLHAAALAGARDDSGVLLAGPTGVGKSTLALALARAGLPFLSDDIVFLRHEGDRIRTIGFADAIGITQSTVQRFADLGPRLASPPAEGMPKRLVRIEDLLGRPAIADCAPAFLVFPSIAHLPASTLTPLESQEALLRLVPDVLLTAPGPTQAHLAAIAALLAQVSCYELYAGEDVDEAATLIRTLL